MSHVCVCSSTDICQPSVRLHSLIALVLYTHTHAYIHIHVSIYIHHWYRTTFGSRWTYRYAWRWTWIKRYTQTTALFSVPMKSHPVYQNGFPVIKQISPTSLTVLRPSLWTDILGCIKFDNWLQWDYCVCRIIHMWKGLQLWAPNHFKFFMPHPLLTQFTFLEVWDKSKGHNIFL